MKWMLILILFVHIETNQDNNYSNEAAAMKFMRVLNKETARWSNLITKSEWEYETNLTNYNMQKKLRTSAKYMAWQKKMWEEVNKYQWENFKDIQLKKQFKKFSILGTAALPDDKRFRLEEVVAEMQKIYSTAKLREWRISRSLEENVPNTPKKENIQLDPDLVSIFSTDPNKSCKLRYYWQGWHDTVGRKVKPLFEEYVTLTNEAAKLNNFTDNAAMWLDEFEMDDFEDEVLKLYLRIRQPYQQLHAYVRRKLSQHFKNDEQNLIQENGLLPAHILGNVWAQHWGSIYQITAPFPGMGFSDVTETAMKAQQYTPLKMVKLAEDFFISLNLSAMTKTFWDKSIFNKLQDTEMVCHASAWDFYDADDFRIKMCTQVNFDDLKTIHHEMGHIQYFQQYKNQPFVFRNGANSGFHEAVGDTLALSVSTAKHLMKIGLLDPQTYKDDKGTEINFLYFMALEKLVFLPYAYLLDLWRWQVFRDQIPPKDYNCRFWELRQELQGISPPIDRSEIDFDAGAKYHVIADVPYIRYFVSYIIQFQFHKALCIEAGQYDPENPELKPLHQCDIYQSTEAGNILSEMLQIGSSKHWQDALQIVTDQRELDAGPLLEYFEPLLEYIERENSRTNENIGWVTDKATVSICKKYPQENKKVKTKSGNDSCSYVIPDEKDAKLPIGGGKTG